MLKSKLWRRVYEQKLASSGLLLLRLLCAKKEIWSMKSHYTFKQSLLASCIFWGQRGEVCLLVKRDVFTCMTSFFHKNSVNKKRDFFFHHLNQMALILSTILPLLLICYMASPELFPIFLHKFYIFLALNLLILVHWRKSCACLLLTLYSTFDVKNTMRVGQNFSSRFDSKKNKISKVGHRDHSSDFFSYLMDQFPKILIQLNHWRLGEKKGQGL